MAETEGNVEQIIDMPESSDMINDAKTQVQFYSLLLIGKIRCREFQDRG